MPSSDGGRAARDDWNAWANDRNTLDLYRRRCREEAEEMTCAAQAAEILLEHAGRGESLLDAGCGGGYYLHALRRRGVEVDYHGLDFTPVMIDLARRETSPRTGVAETKFQLGYIEDLETEFDNVICFNVLTNNPHYALPLSVLLNKTRRRIVLRESMDTHLQVNFTPDPYLDEGKRHIRVYHNTYPIDEVTGFMREHGFEVTPVFDRRTGDGMEMVVGFPHHWRILLAERRA